HEMCLVMATSEMVVSFCLALVSGSNLLQTGSSHPILGLISTGMVALSIVCGVSVNAMMSIGNNKIIFLARVAHNVLGYLTYLQKRG
ncbi:hypothetical protein HK096_001974, partial [Nowakowskiella sp. JEL0078]